MSQEEFLPGLLVLWSGAGELGDVQRLADVVRGGAEEHRLPVEDQRGRVQLDPVDELRRHVVDRSKVGDETRRDANALHQVGRCRRQGPER
ncbi:hypothetical protein ABZV31_25015 [Streptomyces sp. NPDC005202]|uniref:hypothetical protein n=1 Tax=Streptomyces sp. NPDC005202 TaxID=3157021 RepID=UPI0033B2F18A